jgi:hypothetical protein
VRDIAALARLQYQVTRALRTAAARNNLAIFGRISPSTHASSIAAQPPSNVRGRAVSGVAEQRDLAANQGIEGLNVMDFTVGCLRIEGGNQFLYRWRPAAEVAAEIVAQGVPIFGQTGGSGTSKKK